jgi:hypothetical protein
MSNSPINIEEESKIALPLKNLIGVVVAVSVAAFTYTQAINRVTALENKVGLINIEVEENDTWIDNFTPPPEVRETVSRVRELEIRLSILEHELGIN